MNITKNVPKHIEASTQRFCKMLCKAFYPAINDYRVTVNEGDICIEKRLKTGEWALVHTFTIDHTFWR